jgi:hypothetical protein
MVASFAFTRPTAACDAGLAFPGGDRLVDLGFRHQQGFDLGGAHHVAAQRLDEIALAVGDADAPLRQLRDIAGVQPPVAEGGFRRRRLVPVAIHDELAADAELAILGQADFDAR